MLESQQLSMFFQSFQCQQRTILSVLLIQISPRSTSRTKDSKKCAKFIIQSQRSQLKSPSLILLVSLKEQVRVQVLVMLSFLTSLLLTESTTSLEPSQTKKLSMRKENLIQLEILRLLTLSYAPKICSRLRKNLELLKQG